MLFRGTYFDNLCSSEPETDILPLFIEKINEMPLLLLYDILRYVTMGYEK